MLRYRSGVAQIHVEKGYWNLVHLKQDADLIALREREDFKELVRDLEMKSRPVAPAH